jgi:salicylate hydroxylase
MLLRQLPEQMQKHTSKRLVSYSQPAADAPIELAFEDGNSATCDVLVGADGIKSAVRATMLERLAARAEAEGRAEDAEGLRAAVRPRFSGMTSIRAMFPRAKLEGIAPEHAILKGAHRMVSATCFTLA